MLVKGHMWTMMDLKCWKDIGLNTHQQKCVQYLAGCGKSNVLSVTNVQ